MFEGVRILEVSAWVMVPAAGMLLADLGAEVIKVEHPRHGDPARGLVTGGMTPAAGGVNLMVEQTNRGKRSIGLDLTIPEGRAILGELAARSDVFLTSFLPGVRSRLGIDVADMRAHNPDLIYVRADAVGPEGPEAGRPGYDSAVFFGRGGVLDSFAVDETLPQPRPGFGDKTAALSLAYGMAAALFRRERTGEPSEIDVSLLGSATWVASSDILYSTVLGEPFSKSSRPATNPLATRYRTSDDRWIMLAMLTSDRWWPEFCEHLGRPDLIADPRFVDAAARATNHDACGAEIQRAFASRTLAEWRTQLATLSGPWEVIQTSLETGGDEQVRSNGYVETVDHPSGQEITAVRTPVRVDGQPHELRPAPDAWQHTEEIILELGHDWDRIIELKEAGVIA